MTHGGIQSPDSRSCYVLLGLPLEVGSFLEQVVYSGIYPIIMLDDNSYRIGRRYNSTLSSDLLAFSIHRLISGDTFSLDGVLGVDLPHGR